MHKATPMIAAVALACSIDASAQSLPQPVQAAVDDATKDCKVEKGFVTIKDVNGDKVPDYILDTGRVVCGGARSCGSAGCVTQIFASEPDKSYKSVFNDYVQGMKFVQIAGRSAIRLTEHGSACGRAGSDTCYLTLYWNGSDFKPEQAKGDQHAAATPPPAGGLDVLIVEQGGDGQAANCGSSVVAGLKANGDGFLAVRSGPGGQYRQLDALHNGDMVFVFDQRGKWAGIVYGTSNVKCSSTQNRPVPYANKGWVSTNWLKPVAD
ncbi:hypothetical protein [Rhizobium sp. BR 362]|uniref:hypothetical protein n=1 Tax=Rhizobium sp. BR 362 TaxID=3040670 RepID=UPI002F3F8062